MLVLFKKVYYFITFKIFLNLLENLCLDEFWVCYGDHYQANVIQGLIKSSRMTRLELKDKVSLL